uniref:Transmembrane protein 211 n=1 Tax=Athene cunicularia TaxID=194338 RepID=A0A663MEM3_ATHCN
MASGLLVYPFGFNSATVKRFCENSDIYYAGDCQIGWGYMLAIVGVILFKASIHFLYIIRCQNFYEPNNLKINNDILLQLF